MSVSNIRYMDLQENIGGGRGAHTSVSVISPFIRIEQFNEDELRKDGRYRQADDQYRIIATFTLQVEIHAFEKGYRRKHEKIFDSIH
ncbi:hypothetical protein BKA65DRAFT_284572 [Rhexocercosporidium sp. MPI-PUGE-AT-0058]|nr:hypothetical protein BKA65DRAFT_284572 [Rhexocercosporidium sp. MPI-PUGE-AT-0058]